MNRSLIKKIVMPLLLAGLSVPGLAQTADNAPAVRSLAIKDAVDLAKKNNLTVKQALINIALQQQTNKAVTAQALPDLSAAGSTTAFLNTPVTLVPGEFFGGAPGSTIAVSFQPKYAASAGITLNQTLFDGAVFVGLKARKVAVDYYRKALDLTVEQLTVSVNKVYYQLVVGRTQLKLTEANIERAEKLLSDSRAMFQNGFSEKLDVDKASVQLANLETTKANTQTNITNGYLALKYLIGIPIRDSVILTTDFTEDDLASGVSLDSGFRYEDRPDFKVYQTNQQLTQFDIRRYKALYYPTLSITGNYSKNAYNNTYDLFSKNGNWYTSSYVAANLKVPIFSGFSKDANLKKARLNAEYADDQITNLKLSIDNEVAQSRNVFFNAIKTIAYQKTNTTLAESVYEQTKKKFESGLASNTDVTNAQTDLIQAQTNLVNALYDAVIAKVDYLKAIGKI